MPEEIERDMLQHMDKSIEVLKSNLGKIQTGRANPKMIEDTIVDYYGTSTPLNRLATIVAPDQNLLVIQPYDRTQIASIEKAILSAGLGLNPTHEGKVVRIKIPKLSEERREQLTHIIKARGEEAKVALRNIRRDANGKLEQMKNEGAISEDDHHRYHQKNDKAIRERSEEIDKLVKERNKQLRTI